MNHTVNDGATWACVFTDCTPPKPVAVTPEPAMFVPLGIALVVGLVLKRHV